MNTTKIRDTMKMTSAACVNPLMLSKSGPTYRQFVLCCSLLGATTFIFGSSMSGPPGTTFKSFLTLGLLTFSFLRNGDFVLFDVSESFKIFMGAEVAGTKAAYADSKLRQQYHMTKSFNNMHDNKFIRVLWYQI